MTVPEPVPAWLTLNSAGGGWGLKVAVTDWLAFIVTVQVLLVPLLLHAPPHPPNTEFADAVSVSVTRVLSGKLGTAGGLTTDSGRIAGHGTAAGSSESHG